MGTGNKHKLPLGDLYQEILLRSEVQNISLFSHVQYPVAHHIIWNIFLDWRVIAGIYCNCKRAPVYCFFGFRRTHCLHPTLYLLPQLTTAVLVQRRVVLFPVGMLSVMLWIGATLQPGFHPGADSEDEQAGDRGLWRRNFCTWFAAEGNMSGNASFFLFFPTLDWV